MTLEYLISKSISCRNVWDSSGRGENGGGKWHYVGAVIVKQGEMDKRGFWKGKSHRRDLEERLDCGVGHNSQECVLWKRAIGEGLWSKEWEGKGNVSVYESYGISVGVCI